MSLDDLARQYRAYVRTDGSGFRRRARVLQSIWRQEQGFGIGVHSGKSGDRELGSRLPMPWAKESLANYLTDNIRGVVRNEVEDERKSKGKVFKRPRIYDDLLSSQPLCFNLFGELQQNLDLASGVLKSATSGRVGSVTGIEFEYSPGRSEKRFTNDRSAFDVYLTYLNAQGENGFIGIEVKYHENLAGEPARHRERYDEVADSMGCFSKERRPELRSQPLQQIWRDHLLVGAILSEDEFHDGFFVFLYPKANGHCSQAADKYRECLLSTDTFEAWHLETFCQHISSHTSEPWIGRFVDRYLAFEKLESI